MRQISIAVSFLITGALIDEFVRNSTLLAGVILAIWVLICIGQLATAFIEKRRRRILVMHVIKETIERADAALEKERNNA